MITRKSLLANFLPWFIVPLILMFFFPGYLWYWFIMIGGFVVLLVDYIALMHKRWIPVGLAGLLAAGAIGYLVI